MQKTTYYDTSTLFGGYSYQGANGFGYDGPPPQPFQPAAHVENDYQRPACTLQSLGNTTPLAKTKDLNGSCMRPSLPQEHHPPPPISPPPNPITNSSNNNSSNSNGGNSNNQPGGVKSTPSKSSLGSSNNATLTKQIFPWMKESRQNSKQKNSSPNTGICFWNTSPTQKHTYALPFTHSAQSYPNQTHLPIHVVVCFGLTPPPRWHRSFCDIFRPERDLPHMCTQFG